MENSVLFVDNQAAGVIDGDGTASRFQVSATVTNAGLIEGTTSKGLIIGEDPMTNSGTMAALGSSATLVITSATVTDSTTKALILGSGNGALVDLDK